MCWEPWPGRSLLALAFGWNPRLSKAALKILIIPDKFKGTLTAREAAEAIAAGWRAVRPEDQLELLPMSDGGDGFGEIIGGMMEAEPINVQTIDSARRPCQASFWLRASSATAIIETAQVNGLALLPPGKFHPFELDTFGLGKVLQEAVRADARKALVGIGGSATNDGGFGMVRALGWGFHSQDNLTIERWTDLDKLSRIEAPKNPLQLDVTVACDVQNPLLGKNGASRIYGPQKGLREQDMAKAEACLGQLAEVAKSHFGYDFANDPGSGAAGGLGFGLRAFLNGKFVSGADVFAEAARLDERLNDTDVVISGEGAIDVQSLMGKGVGAIFERCQRRGVKRIGLAGSLGPGVEEQFGRDPNLLLMAIVPNLTAIEQAKAEPAKWLRALSMEAAKKCVPE